MNSSKYIDAQRKSYSMYVLQDRAIPAVTDGLKSAARRILWIARDGNKYKSATLAGATMPIHPHAEASGTINTITGRYKNNIPLLTGSGAFGTILKPNAYGASRYTSVKISQFTKDVILKDIEIIPMKDNYDGTIREPVHFIPLIPVVLLNPSEGIAVGFASKILPRSLPEIIEAQLLHLKGKKFEEAFPHFIPTNNKAAIGVEDEKGSVRWTFGGSYTTVDATTIKITKLPYGIVHKKYLTHLMKLIDNGDIVDYTDRSKDKFKIDIKFKRGALAAHTKSSLTTLLKLTNNITENFNILSFDGEGIWSTNYNEIIKEFSDWRLTWYEGRYQRLADLLSIDIQRYKDVILAITKNVSGQAKKINSRGELKEFLEAVGIVHVDYIADLPIYRFTMDEKKKVQDKIKEANDLMKTYNLLLKSKPERCKVYIEELKQILKQHKKGTYQ